MKIACLGWGSLIWRPEKLLVRNKWFEDGPIIPIEFTRESSDKRITLVITDNAKPIRVLWALMSTDNLQTAIESLQQRKGIADKNRNTLIGRVKVDDKPTEEIKKIILDWLKVNNLDAAIWTDLKPKFKNKDKTPSIKEVLGHLTDLGYQAKKHAEEYIRKTPKQIDTDYRREIEMKLGWTKIE